jgi:Calx-beta domain-containing protein
MARRTILVFSVLITVVLTSATITPAGARPAAKPRLTATGSMAAEDGGTAVVQVQLSKKAKKALTVTWKAGGGTATAGADYGPAATGTATIKKGKKTTQVVIPLLEDATDEANETFTVAVTAKGARAARPVTVTIVDNDATPPPVPTPSALVGTLKAVQKTPDPVAPARQVTTTLLLNVHLVPTGAPGEWRDDGTGNWSISGSGTEPSAGCPGSTNSTQVTGNGAFLPGAGEPAAGQAAFVLNGFSPTTGASTPTLTWKGIASATRTTNFLILPVPPTCLPTTTAPEGWESRLDAPGATGSYATATGVGRGVVFDFGDVSTTKVTGTLYPVP